MLPGRRLGITATAKTEPAPEFTKQENIKAEVTAIFSLVGARQCP
ncbi:MAG: hypothetical protein ACSI46_17165 [Gloeotrichia echinulata DVL01]